FIINVLLILGWHRAAERIEVHIPPSIPSTGLNMKANEIPGASVYSFAYYVWQAINYWPNNGLDDYKKAIEAFSPSLTPRFKAFLLRDYQDRSHQGEVQERQRSLQGLNGTAFSVHDVKYLGRDTWVVHLHLRLSEHMNLNANLVKDIAIDYTLRVV